MLTRRAAMYERSRRSPHAGNARPGRRTSSCPGRRSNWSRRPSCIRTSRRPSRARRSWNSGSTIEEKKIVIDDKGTKLQAMTFNGSMPGPLMVVHEGDYVEVTLVNPDTNSMPHNIDFHSATGALGGGELTLVNPGEQVVLRWKATRTGVFVYHCAPGGPMIPWHVVSGMNGAVMVLPRDGLDRRQRQAAALRPGLLHRRAGPVRTARREGQIQVLRLAGEPTPTPWR